MTRTSRNLSQDIDWTLWFWRGLFLLLLFRVLYLAFFPYGLAGDEAYYWDWGRHPALGYFSKPPLIGWLMALAAWTGGDSVFGIRIFAVLLGTGALIFLFFLGHRMYGSRAAFWGIVAMVACPGNAALNLLLTIDAPLLFFWSGSLYFFWRLLTAEKRRATWGTALILSPTSELAFYLPDRPQAYRWVEGGKIQSQYELCPGPSRKKCWDCLIIKGKPLRAPSRLSKEFQKIRRLTTVTRDFQSGRSRVFTLFLGTGGKERPSEENHQKPWEKGEGEGLRFSLLPAIHPPPELPPFCSS